MRSRTKSPNKNDLCEIECVNKENVRAAMNTMPEDDAIFALAETFRVMSDPNRVRIISALSRYELCVCDLSRILGLTGSAVSHQLRLLRGQGLVRYRKEGKVAYYSLSDEHISNLFKEGVRHVKDK